MALGDTIYLQLSEDITGWGKGGQVIGPMAETLTTEALVTNGLAKVVTGSSLPPFIPADSATRSLIAARRLADRRAKLPLTTAPTSVTQSGAHDATLTKSYVVPTTGLVNGTVSVLNATQLAGMPIDWGTPAFQKVTYYSSPTAYVWSCASKDPLADPAGAAANNLITNEVRMLSNAPKMEILLYPFSGPTTEGYSLFIDGQPVQVRPTASGSAIYYLTLVFPDSTPREINLRTSAGIGGIWIAPGYDVWKPPAHKALSAYSIGDSYSSAVVYNDAGTVAALQDEGLPTGMEDWLGLGYHYIDAVGGTGWTVRAAGGYQGPNNNYQDRWLQVLRANPDVLIVPNGAANDCATLVDPNVIAAAILSCFGQLRQQNSATRFIYADGFTPPSGNYATNGARYVALRNILQPLLAGVGVYYIDTTTWLYGTGRLGAPAGNGPADFYVGADSIHQSGLGYRVQKMRMARVVARCLEDDGTLLNTVLTG